MPKGRGGKRRKRRTHAAELQEAKAAAALPDNVPRSFVFKSGRVAGYVKELASELRQLMGPFTAAKLRERRRATMKDYVAVAAPLGVTHLLMLSQPDEHINLKIARSPQGPTLTFRLLEFSLCRHVKALQKRPMDPAGALKTPPLVVLNNFGGDSRAQVRLAAVTLQNLFPSIDVSKLRLTQCRRVVLFSLDKETDTIELRHYCIRATPAGVNRGVRKIVRTKVPNLGRLDDISDFVLGKGYTGGAEPLSESEGEDEASQVILPERYTGRGNMKSQKSTVRLSELGPRMTLKLWKVERGMAEGDVLYHAHVVKTPEEAAALRRKAFAKQQEKKRRREEQESNVQRKTEEKEAKKAKREQRRQERAKRKAEALEKGDEVESDGATVDDEDIDLELNQDVTDRTDDAMNDMEALDVTLPHEPEADFDYSDAEEDLAEEFENEDDD